MATTNVTHHLGPADTIRDTRTFIHAGSGVAVTTIGDARILYTAPFGSERQAAHELRELLHLAVIQLTTRIAEMDNQAQGDALDQVHEALDANPDYQTGVAS